MKAIWNKVTKELVNVLNVHPKVKGFQILNDNGMHLLGAYENKWIPDTPSKRKNFFKYNNDEFKIALLIVALLRV